MEKPLRIIILEDRDTDADLVEYELQEAGFVYTAQRAVTEKEFVQALKEFSPDIILSDFDLPQYNGLSALAEAKALCPDVPFILVTGAIGEDPAIDILTRGAKDYVMKHRLHRLAPAVRRALAEAKEHAARQKAEGALRKTHRYLEIQVEKRTAELRAEVAERKRVEASLLASKQRIEAILESITDIYLVVDKEWRICEMNRQAEIFYGVRAADLIGRPYGEVFPLAPDDECQKMIAAAMAERLPVHFEEFYPALNRWLETHVYPHEDGLAFYRKDITLRKQNETGMKDYARRLEAVNRELESFSYSVSHDLREPLRAIDGYSRMLVKDLRDSLDEEGRRKLDAIRDKTKRMNQLIDEILNFSRLSRQALSVSVVDMEELAREIWQDFREARAKREITLELASLPACRGDRNLLKRVFTNLFSNALKFTDGKRKAAVHVGGYENPDEHVYYVRDNGAGFDMEYADRLFKLFQRLHGVEEFEGTGVGLAIVQRIITRQGGRVWAEGKVGDGATFYFTLPRTPGKELVSTPAACSTRASKGPAPKPH